MAMCSPASLQRSGRFHAWNTIGVRYPSRTRVAGACSHCAFLLDGGLATAH